MASLDWNGFSGIDGGDLGVSGEETELDPEILDDDAEEASNVLRERVLHRLVVAALPEAERVDGDLDVRETCGRCVARRQPLVRPSESKIMLATGFLSLRSSRTLAAFLRASPTQLPWPRRPPRLRRPLVELLRRSGIDFLEKPFQTKSLGLTGVLVLDAPPNGFAGKAGLLPTKRDACGRLVLGDIITSVNGQKVSSGSDLYRILDQCRVGDKVFGNLLLSLLLLPHFSRDTVFQRSHSRQSLTEEEGERQKER